MKQVKELIRGKLISVTPNTLVAEAARTLRDNEISGCPVIDLAGNLRGVISRTNILDYAVASGNDALGPVMHTLMTGGVSDDDAGGLEVQDVMTGDVYSVTADAPVNEVAALMHRERIHRVPVIDGSAVVGVVTSLDLLGEIGA